MVKWTRNNVIVPNKWLILIILGLLIGLFLFIFHLRDKININDKHLPITAFVSNESKNPENITIELNDSIHSMIVDSMKEIYFKTCYRLGINHVKISIDSHPIIDDTFLIHRRNPGAISVEIDKPADELGFRWKIDSLKIKDYYFYKSIIGYDSVNRLKFAVSGKYLE